jgi:signal peptidase II
MVPLEMSDQTSSPEAVRPEEGKEAAVRAAPVRFRPNYVFLGVVSAVSLALDLASKAWAVKNLDDPFARVELVRGYMALVLAHNRGGAWGLLQDQSESVRRPFFVLVSIFAIAFIVMMYRKLEPGQRALKWGLPLVLGGALGNLVDRIRYGHVIDFIDVYAGKGGAADKLLQSLFGPMREYHWPTFNVADIAICIGVGLMAVDMFTSRKPNTKQVVAEKEADKEVYKAADAHPKDEAPPAADEPAPEEPRA